MVEQADALGDADQIAWSGLVSEGIAKAIEGLSEMVGAEMTVNTLRPRSVEVKQVPYLFGGPEVPAVGVYLQVSGGAEGQILLAYKPSTAFELVDLLMGEAPGTTQSLGEIEQSGLGEMGNIMGAFFLNSLSDSTGIRLLPSPPSVMMDMAGADRQMCGAFLVLPNPELLAVLTGRVAQE
jgi:chemotaxis protein CheC